MLFRYLHISRRRQSVRVAAKKQMSTTSKSKLVRDFCVASDALVRERVEDFQYRDKDIRYVDDTPRRRINAFPFRRNFEATADEIPLIHSTGLSADRPEDLV